MEKSRFGKSLLIIIPTLNEAENILSVISSLISQSRAIGESTIVVVDGGSTDDTQRVVEQLAELHPLVKLLHNPRGIQSCGLNLAVDWYGKDRDLIVRCDAHSIYPPDFLPRLVASYTKNGAESVAVVMDSQGSTCIQRAIAWVSDSLIGSGGSAHRGRRRSGFVDHGHHAVISVQKFREVGGYDATFTHNEDAEFDYRLRAFGGKIYLDADIRVAYQPRSTLLGLWRQYFNYGVGRSRTMRRHPSSVRLRQIAVPFNFLGSLFASLAIPVTSKFLWWPASYLAAVCLASFMLALKKRSVCAIFAFPAAFIMHNAWAAGFFYGLLRVRERRWSFPENVAS
jgi:succinoglycan biosynthesis protein ExoA